MWLLTSMGRPDRIRQLVNSYTWGSESRVVVVLYEKDPRAAEYIDAPWPPGWKVETVPMLGNGATYNEMLRRYPDEKHYGFLADDQLLDTPGMLRNLARHAGDWHIAYANDQHHGETIPTMPCIGGDLVRAVGYLSPPNIVHWGIDCAWHEIGRRLGALRYQSDLKYTHLNPVWGTAPDDKTYKLARQRSFGYNDYLRAFIHGGECDRAVKRVHQAKLQRAA